MPYQLDQRPEQKVILFEWGSSMLPEDAKTSNQAVKDFAEQVEGDFVSIHQVDNLSVAFSDLVQIFAAGLKAERGVTLADRHIIAVVGTTGLLKIGVQALSQSQYGGFRVWRFDTIDEALEAAAEHFA